MSKFSLVISTFFSEEEAQNVADNLVKKRYAAFAHLQEVKSSFVWNENFENLAEFRLECLIYSRKFASVKAEIRELSSHDLPEIVVVPAKIDNETEKWVDDWLEGEFED
ncbi:divalent cation tolerance protein CutA [Lactococcus nasutitermitis]|uniref:Divalent cation tolerance protein CutA n=1 Tax=Lactococcus nasutitermitis TaxID=1652957 RepID=A0ABV9JGT0_9LACT|nr:divalent cation tolerance protein CutA [Lactococcus nasutitermitis]